MERDVAVQQTAFNSSMDQLSPTCLGIAYLRRPPAAAETAEMSLEFSILGNLDKACIASLV